MNSKEIIDSIEFLELCEYHIGLVKEICDYAKIDKKKLYKMVSESPEMRKILMEWKKGLDDYILKGEIIIDA